MSLKTLGTQGRGETPPADQLWNVIEFSSRFPELTLELASVLKAVEHPAGTPGGTAEEELKFPDLTALDPAAVKAQRDQEHQKQTEKTEAVFAEGRSLSPPAAAKGKRRLWIGLLIAAFLLFLLLMCGLQRDREQQEAAAPQKAETHRAAGEDWWS